MPQEEVHQPVNGFNSAEVNAFLSRDVGVAAYKPADVVGSGRGSGGAWASKRKSEDLD